MSGLPILDVALGLAFVYLLLALVCTTVMEWIAQIRNLRGTMLHEGTQRLFGEEGAASPAITKAYFQHPLVKALQDGDRLPSYVPATVFSKALGDVLSHQPQGGGAVAPDLRRSLKALDAEGAASGKPVAEWYDDVMQRVAGTYKRHTRGWVLGLAFAVTILMNANTVTLASRLWESPTLRDYALEHARVRLAQGPPLETVEYTQPTSPIPTAPIAPDSTRSPTALLPEEGALLGQLFGWSTEGAALRQDGLLLWIVRHLIGWTLTAFAVSLGAPFWFDTLNRFMSLRASGRAPLTTVEREKAAGK
jgi:hypothetical protein